MTKKHKRYRSDFLFSQGSYLIGAGSVFNIAGNYFDFNRSITPQEADGRALQSDWGVIGQDFNDAISSLRKECNLKALQLDEHCW